MLAAYAGRAKTGITIAVQVAKGSAPAVRLPSMKATWRVVRLAQARKTGMGLIAARRRNCTERLRVTTVSVS